MTARKGRSKTRRTARGHRQSSMGQILPPIDVRSKGMIGEMMKRLNKGTIAIFVFYMDGCSHCHDFMPHFDKAAKNPNRSVQAIKVNEPMLSDVQEAIKRKNKNAKDFNITGFPSLLIVGPDGNKITDLDHVNDTKVMTDVMNNAASMAQESGVTQNAPTNVEMEEPVEMSTSIGSNSVRSVTPNFIATSEENGVAMSMRNKKPSANANANNNANNANANANNNANMTNANANANVNMNNASKAITADEAEKQASLLSPAAPPTNASLANDTESPRPLSGTKGGSLYTAMSQSAYTLAAPAALLATAALMMKHTRKRTRKQKRSRTRRV